MSGNHSGHIFHIDFDQFSGFKFSFEIFVLGSFHPVLPYEPLFFQDFPDRAGVDLSSFFLELPMNLLSAFLGFGSNGKDLLLEPDRGFCSITLWFG